MGAGGPGPARDPILLISTALIWPLFSHPIRRMAGMDRVAPRAALHRANPARKSLLAEQSDGREHWSVAEREPGMRIEAMTSEDWPEVRDIYLAGMATGNATFETDAP